MKKFILGSMFSLGLLLSQNNYPIVLIHGFMGWGESEMGGYNYWGGHNDFVQSLKDNGHLIISHSIVTKQTINVRSHILSKFTICWEIFC